MFDFISEYKTRIEKMHAFMPRLVTYFRAMGLVRSYALMIQLFSERAPAHPEIARTPELFDYMRMHFARYATSHINPSTDTIWNREFVGTSRHLRAWQNAGYPLSRNAANFDRRLEVWAALWEGTPIVKEVSYRTKRGKTVRQMIEFWPKHKDPPHADGSIEATMEARNTNYDGTARYVPFWLPLNYGTRGDRRVGPRYGYPSSEGLHFVDIAEQAIPKHLAASAQLLDSYLAELLVNNEPVDTLTTAEGWLKSRVTVADMYDVDLDVFAIGREVAES